MKLLSIIIPYYKTRELTIKLLNNLTRQTNSRVEIILVDDGCWDDWSGYGVKTIYQENSGVSKARNVGIDASTGKFITFIDSDDDVSRNYVKVITRKIAIANFDYCLFSWESERKKFIVGNNPLHKNKPVWNCIYKRSLINTHRFNETMVIREDKDFNERVRKGGKMEIIPDILYFYSLRKGSLTRPVKESRL